MTPERFIQAETPDGVLEKSIDELSSQWEAVTKKISDALQSPWSRYAKKYPKEKLWAVNDVLRELSTQRFREYYGGINNGGAQQLAENMAAQNPELLKIYREVLGDIRIEEEKKIREEFEAEALKLSSRPDAEASISEKIIPLQKTVSPEERKGLRNDFPSGNFLLHTTSVKNAVDIMRSGHIKVADEIAKEKELDKWGQGGQDAISFNMNDVRVLYGDERHFVGFLVAPEDALDENTWLEIGHAKKNLLPAMFEVALAPRRTATAKLLRRTRLPKIPIEKTYLVVNHADADIVAKILARHGHIPKGILTYPPTKLRVESWTEPTGDYEAAGNLLRGYFFRSGVEPTISWEKDLFVKKPEIANKTYVTNIESAKHIVKKNGLLEITPS